MITMARFVIRSEDRINPTGTTTDDFVVKLDSEISGRYAVRTIQMPNALYNVTSTRYKIYINSTTVSITQGFYDGIGLASLIQSTLRTSLSDASFTCSYSTTTGKFTIARSTNFTLDWASGSATSGDDLATVLGWPNSNYSGASTYTAPNMANLVSTRAVCINIAEAKMREVRCTNGRSACAIHMPIDQSFLSFCIWQPNTENTQYVNLPGTQTLSIKILDENGQPLSLNGVNWSLHLQKVANLPSDF